MKAYAYVKKGLSHEKGVCEDAVLINDIVIKGGYHEFELPDNCLVAVADGIGGSTRGDVASGLALLGLASLDRSDLTIHKICDKIFEQNRVIYEIGDLTTCCSRTGSTLTLLAKLDEGMFVCQLGNSRLYKVNDMGPICLTTDRNVYRDLLNDKKVSGVPEGISVDDIIGTPQQFMLTTHLGMNPHKLEEELDVTLAELNAGERIIMTSDGIHDHLSHLPSDEFAALFTSKDEPKVVLERFVEAALEGESKDDLSVIMIEM